MRKNVSQVLDAWESGRSLKTPSVWTDGKNIYSYDTIILRGATHDGEPRPHTLNATKYSATTSRQQSEIRLYFALQGHELPEVTGIPMGAREF